MLNFVPFPFHFVSADHEEFFHQAVHATGTAYPPTIAALYLLAACAETRERVWEVMDPDGNIKDDCWDLWQDEDSRRCVALAVNLTGGGSYPVLSPAYLYDTPIAPVLWAATEFWFRNRDIA